MNDSIFFLNLVQQALIAIVKISLPIFSFAIFTGLLVGFIQSITQIQDSSIAFVPKIFAIIISLLLFGRWMLDSTIKFCGDILLLIPYICQLK